MLNDEFKNKKIIISWLTDKENKIEYRAFDKFVNNFSDCGTKISSSISIIINYIKKLNSLIHT